MNFLLQVDIFYRKLRISLWHRTKLSTNYNNNKTQAKNKYRKKAENKRRKRKKKKKFYPETFGPLNVLKENRLFFTTQFMHTHTHTYTFAHTCIASIDIYQHQKCLNYFLFDKLTRRTIGIVLSSKTFSWDKLTIQEMRDRDGANENENEKMKEWELLPWQMNLFWWLKWKWLLLSLCLFISSSYSLFLPCAHTKITNWYWMINIDAAARFFNTNSKSKSPSIYIYKKSFIWKWYFCLYSRCIYEILSSWCVRW